jgi:hypothetical protein
VGELEDRVAIGDLVRAYASLIDRLDRERFASLWTDDAVLTVHRPDPSIDPVSVAGDALAEIPDRLAELWQRTFHLVSNHTVSLDGDTATGEAYCEAHHTQVIGGVHVCHVMTIRYDDDYRRTAAGWRFAGREVNILWTRNQTINGPIAPR